MKLGVIVREEFQTALVKLVKSDLPIKTAFKLKGIAKTVASEQEKYERVRNDLIQKLGKKDNKGRLVVTEQGTAEFADKDYQKFLAKLQELRQVDVEIPSLHISELEGLDEGFSAQDFLYLDGLIDG